MDHTNISTPANQISSVKTVRFSNRPIYGKFSIVLLGVIFVSILPYYVKVYNTPEIVSATFIVHSILYFGWYILFAAQSNLVSSGNFSAHKKLGYMSVALFVFLIISGVEMLIGVMAAYDPNWTGGHVHSRASFVWGILHTLFSFFIFYILGIFFRKQLQLHKRFMLMASLSMVSASVTRVAFLPFIPVEGTILTLVATYAFLLTPMVIDRLAFNAIHPVFKWCVPIYVVTQIICIGILPATEIGRAIAFPLQF